MGQRAMIGGCEIMVEQNYAELFKFFPHILKKLYDLDIAEEDVILTWGKKPSKRYVTKKLSADLIKNSEKVLEWLREAETESEENLKRRTTLLSMRKKLRKKLPELKKALVTQRVKSPVLLLMATTSKTTMKMMKTLILTTFNLSLNSIYCCVYTSN